MLSALSFVNPDSIPKKGRADSAISGWKSRSRIGATSRCGHQSSTSTVRSLEHVFSKWSCGLEHAALHTQHIYTRICSGPRESEATHKSNGCNRMYYYQSMPRLAVLSLTSDINDADIRKGHFLTEPQHGAESRPFLWPPVNLLYPPLPWPHKH